MRTLLFFIAYKGAIGCNSGGAFVISAGNEVC